ncbi:CocE/NonD family hydrolase [Haloterrigena alkaliphila]|uniref:CocE/NonD family hydrolase n=1 Tax=Haloterrigena alkaliphila TaxID=2816475 RepID=UPI001CFFFFD8|nr:CocE/NonD family hydrolase [Haloterrigena alkaliphila]UHQ95082.1 CocE/NonD family hydrolase [Haloterrigena alkaliphila]
MGNKQHQSDGVAHMTEKGDPLNRRTVLKFLGIAATGAVGGPVALDQITTPVRAAPSVSSEKYTKDKDVGIKSFDGIKIKASLYKPTEEGPHPAILMTHGWGGSRKGDGEQELAEYYAANGYVVLVYDSRGFGDSEGKVASTSERHQKDASQLITWLAGHDQVITDSEDNPRIGMDGGSYGGGIQFRTAAFDNRLDAIIPRITWHNLAYSLAPNGVLKWGWYYPLVLAVQGREIHPEHQEISNSIQNTMEMNEEARKYYRTRSPISYLDQVSTPTLIVHGWYDRLFFPNEAVANFQGLSDEVEDGLIIDNHSGHFLGEIDETDDQAETQNRFVSEAVLNWLDAHLKGDGDHGLAKVNLYNEEEDTFEQADQFPPSDVTEETYQLSSDRPQGWKVQLRNEPDPDREVVRIDVPVEDVSEILGTPKLSMRVVPTGKTTRLVAGLEKVSDGSTSLIKEQITAVEVDKPTRLELELPTVHEVLDNGDSLQLAITTRDSHLTVAPYTPETGFYVDGEHPSGAVLQNNRGHLAELTLPIR